MEAVVAVERRLADGLVALRLKIWEMRIRMFVLRLPGGLRGTASAMQWYRNAKGERESEERALVFSTAFLNAVAKRARDEEALTRLLAPPPKLSIPKTPSTKRPRSEHRDHVDRDSGRARDKDGGGGHGSGGGARGGGGNSESSPS